MESEVSNKIQPSELQQTKKTPNRTQALHWLRIPETSEIKHLGVHFDKGLRWKKETVTINKTIKLRNLFKILNKVQPRTKHGLLDEHPSSDEKQTGIWPDSIRELQPRKTEKARKQYKTTSYEWSLVRQKLLQSKKCNAKWESTSSRWEKHGLQEGTSSE